MHEKLFQKLEIATRRYEALQERVDSIIFSIATRIYEDAIKTQNGLDMFWGSWEYNWRNKTYTVASYFRGEREHNKDLTFPESLIFNPGQIQPYIDNLIKEKVQKELDLKAIRKQNLLKELETL